MKRDTTLTVWQLIIFNALFVFIAGFIARYSQQSEALEHIVYSIFGFLFIIFLLYININHRKYLVGLKSFDLLKVIGVGFFVGLLMWYTMVLLIPTIQLILAACNSEFCSDISQRFYPSINAGSISDLSLFLIIAMIIRFVIITPFREELLYRTAMMLSLHKKYSVLTSVIIIALIFSVFHLRYFVFAIGYSLVMSALVLKYRNILPAVVAHATYNLTIYFLYPTTTVIGHYSNLGLVEILIVISLLINIYFWSCYTIKKYSLNWLN